MCVGGLRRGPRSGFVSGDSSVDRGAAGKIGVGTYGPRLAA